MAGSQLCSAEQKQDLDIYSRTKAINKFDCHCLVSHAAPIEYALRVQAFEAATLRTLQWPMHELTRSCSNQSCS